MRPLFEDWGKLYDVPDSNGYENIIRIADRIQDDLPRLEALVKEYRAVTGETPSGSSLDLLENELAKLKEYLDDTVRRREELEKMDTP